MPKKDFKFTPNINGATSDVLKELADELVYNYLANSFGDEDLTGVDFENIIDPGQEALLANLRWLGLENETDMNAGAFYNERRKQLRRCRNIMIIGAGASYDAYNAIPLGAQMVNSFKEIFSNKIGSIPFLKDKYDHEEAEIRKLLKGDLDFENYLYLLSTFFVKQETLREEIKNHTGFRYAPSLFYEITAHLLKHSFLDAVINFNFDEILDQCLQEEMGKENYHFILSDGHTNKLEDIIVAGRIKAPIYIKPHGTFSHKSSLRFTKRHYLDVPPDVQEMLKNLLNGFRGGGKEVQRVNIICVGFDLASIEFNDIVDGSLAPSSRIYHFLHKPGQTDAQIKTDVKKHIFDRYFEEFLSRAVESGNTFDSVYHPINLANFNQPPLHNKGNDAGSAGVINSLTTPLGECFSNLWRAAYSRFNKFNRPRSIGRHEIISYLFYDHSFSGTTRSNISDEESRRGMRKYYDCSAKYFRDRVLVEIAVDLLRNNGNIDIVEILKGRTGEYFALYEAACKKFPTTIRERHSIYELLHEFTAASKMPESFKEQNELQETKIIFRISELTPEFKEKCKTDIRVNFEKPFDKSFSPKKPHPTKEELELAKKQTLDKLMDAIEDAYKEHKESSPLGVTILLYLLRSEYLSSRFRENFLANFQKKVYNGLAWNETGEEGNTAYKTFVNELFRLFAKSNTLNFYNIKTKISDSSYKLWESFTPKNVLHTNLVLSTDFKSVFKEKNWDCLLGVFETGSNVKYIFEEYFNMYISGLGKDESRSMDKARAFFNSLTKKTILLLCSMESVEQIHLLEKNRYSTDSYVDDKGKSKIFFTDKKVNYNPDAVREADEKYKIEILTQLHLQNMCDFMEAAVKQNEKLTHEQITEIRSFSAKVKKCLHLVFVPFLEHNHHCSIFLKSVSGNDEVLKNASESLVTVEGNVAIDEAGANQRYMYFFEAGYHMYRRGFSNSLNPVKLGQKDRHIKESYVKRDIDKLLLFFFNTLCRGIAFQVQNAILIKYKQEFIVRELMHYRSWSPEEFYRRMQMFMANLYIYSRKNPENQL